MRRIAYAALMMMGVLTIAGCAKVDELFSGKTKKITFVASFADDTRTSYQGEGKVDWEEGDSILYYTKKGGSIGEYEVVRSGHSTNVVADVTSGTSYIIAAYGGTGITDNTVTSFTLNGAVKAEQTGKFEDAHVSVAKGFDIEDGASLKFHNMTSLIKFTLERTDVSYITFTANGGEKIHGNGKINISLIDDAPSAAFGDEGGSTIHVNTNGAGTFYIAMLPVGLSKGFEIKYRNAAGYIFAHTVYDNSFVIGSNEMVNLGTLDGRMESYTEFEYVDLGLSVEWAACNLGALHPEQYGNYYQWAGLQNATSPSIERCPFHIASGWTKYVQSYNSSYWLGSGNPDNKTVLDPEDDVAHVKLGGKWRMPTDAEWHELITNCTCEEITLHGVKGRKFTCEKNGNSIFLPAAGYYRPDDYLYDVGSRGNYWSSSLDSNHPGLARYMFFAYYGVGRDRTGREYCQSVRPVYEFTGVSLSKTSLSLEVDEMYTLSATVAPSNDTETTVSWSSSNISVATVDANGKVTAVGAGTATITVKTVDGGYTANCSISVIEKVYQGPELVDLGLSVKWAACNLGALSPEQYGGYYQWAGLPDVTSTSRYLDWSNCPYHTGSRVETGWTKYVHSNWSRYWSGSGSPDNKKVLDPEDDVAHVKLGDKWRIPTIAEWYELAYECTWAWTYQNRVRGYKVTSKQTGNSIFLPAAGCRDDTDLYSVGSCGFYWSSSLNTGGPSSAYSLSFNSSNVGGSYSSRYRFLGQSVRPVSE